MKTTYANFEAFLAEKHAENYRGTDDEMSDDCQLWMENLDLQEVIDYADEYAGAIKF